MASSLPKVKHKFISASSQRGSHHATASPALLPQVEAEGPAALVGLAEGDQLVSLNDQPCADVALSEIMALADGSAHSLRLLVKR
ncbi:hypothetical protein Z043_109451 [Scleropages formosus]|uniref:PDZ domain-containing protein n=1 Tax=Scleropages formosus TaxID=113540 RepID=A0A0P7UPY1_SCLFO|nr:hypothetical protein Z043_109451 [Scleropages formosus]